MAARYTERGLTANADFRYYRNTHTSITRYAAAYNGYMKPIVVRDPAKFDRTLGKLVAMPPEKRSDVKAAPKVTPKR